MLAQSRAPDWRRRAAAVLLLGAALWLTPASGFGADEEPVCCCFSFARAINGRAFRWIAPAIDGVGAELRAVGEDVATGADTRMSAWSAIGEGFLRHAQRGDGLGGLALFDLGRVAASGEEAADEVIGRVEAVLSAFRARLEQDRTDAGLVPWKVEGLDGDGRLSRREDLASLLKMALAPDAPRRLSLRLPSAGGGALPVVTNVGEIPLLAPLRITYLSNAVRFRRSMPAAIRPVTVDLFFTVKLNGSRGGARRWYLTPSAPRTGHPLRFHSTLFRGVFASKSDLRGFAAVLDPDLDLWRTRIEWTGHLLDAAQSEQEGGRVPRALARAHELLDLLGPVYACDVYRRIDTDLRRWFAEPSTRVLADLADVAGTVGEALTSPPVRELFAASGDLAGIGSAFAPTCRRLANGLPPCRDGLEHLAAEVERLAGLGANAPIEDWRKLETRARDLAVRTAPDSDAIREVLRLLEAPFLEAGYRRLPVLGVEGGHIVVAATGREADGRPGVTAAALRSLRHGDFGFERSDAAAAPRAHLLVRVFRGWMETRAHQCLRCRLARCDGCLVCRLRLAGARVR